MKLNKALIAVIFHVLSIHFVYAQESETKTDAAYFWFTVKIEPSYLRSINSDAIGIKKIDKQIQSGTLFQFFESAKNNLKKHMVTIGPFISEKSAYEAVECYTVSKNAESGVNNLLDNLVDGNSKYCFYARPVFNGRKPLKFTRVPARVDLADNFTFIDWLNEGLSFLMFAIGPFDDYLAASVAKYTYRKYGEKDFTESEKNQNPPLDMYRMAQRWKDINAYISQSKIDSSQMEWSGSLVIEIPNDHFVETVIQAIQAELQIEGQTIQTQGKTLQGAEVRDNNPVNSGFPDHLSFHLYAPYKKNSKYQVVIKSIIFDDQNMLHCENIVIGID
jgi:hypothetical protein